jgi:hypothetical protein
MGDESSVEGSVDRAAPQELRASHADRDHVVETLRDAAAEGRLTPGELDERVERALGARTLRELAALTRDLPEQRANPSIPSTDVVKIEKRFGTAEWTGTWLVPRRMEIRLTVGNAKLDFTNAVITHDQLSIDVDLGIGGNLTLITKPGIVVVASDVIVRSMAEIKVRTPRQDPNYPVALHVEVTGQLRGGGRLPLSPDQPRQPVAIAALGDHVPFAVHDTLFSRTLASPMLTHRARAGADARWPVRGIYTRDDLPVI